MKQTPEERRATLGSSDVAAAIGLNPYRTPVDVYAEKVGLTEPKAENEAMHFGHVLEEVIAKEFSRRTGRKVRRRRRTDHHPEHTFLTCHIDRSVDGEQEIVECKNVGHYASGDWGEDGSDQVPDQYLAQTYHQMNILGWRKATIVALFGGNRLQIHPIQWDGRLAKLIEMNSVDFWNNHVVANVPPAPMNQDDVNVLWKFSGDEIIEADDEIMHCLVTLKELREQSEGISEQEDNLRLQLKDLMRDRQAIVDREGTPLVTWKTHEAKHLDRKLLQAEHPEIDLDVFSPKRPVRSFLIKWGKL